MHKSFQRADRNLTLPLAVAFLFLSLTGCSVEPGVTLPQAYVAPATVNVRSELNQKNSTVVTLKHGDRVSILDVRRRYVKVRTAAGYDGWVDSLDLLRPQDMDRIQRERAAARKLPVEAYATAYENLNIHLDPSRVSPAFAQIPEGGAVSILARKVVAKAPPGFRPTIVFEKPKLPARGHKKERKSNPHVPPMPPAPKAPGDQEAVWGSTEHAESDEPATPAGKKDKPAPVTPEAWTLIRTKSNQTGWVLSRNLMMSIPDDVAQYAEGKHITAYFDLGTVNDDERGPKHNWLWTTISGAEPYDFDSWRVFLWNRHRHRFETSYRMRDVEGYFPVRVDASDSPSPGRTFHLLTKDDDGRLRERTYFFDGTRVHLTATENYAPPSAAAPSAASSTPAKQSWLLRQWSALKQRFTTPK